MRELLYYYQIEEAYEELLNEIYPEVEICGYNFESGRAHKLVNDIEFNRGCFDWCSVNFVEVYFENMTTEEIEHYGAIDSTVLYYHVDDINVLGE